MILAPERQRQEGHHKLTASITYVRVLVVWLQREALSHKEKREIIEDLYSSSLLLLPFQRLLEIGKWISLKDT